MPKNPIFFAWSAVTSPTATDSMGYMAPLPWASSFIPCAFVAEP
jgi:hypothetical protein